MEKYFEISIYYLLINFILFLLMGMDKNKAKKNKWRIKENTLFVFSLLGGCIGGLVGMSFFHHKTKKVKFYLVFWSSLILHFAALCYFYIYK